MRGAEPTHPCPPLPLRLRVYIFLKWCLSLCARYISAWAQEAQNWSEMAPGCPKRPRDGPWSRMAPGGPIGPGWPQEDQTGSRRAQGEAFGRPGGPKWSRMAPGGSELVRDGPKRPRLAPGGPLVQNGPRRPELFRDGPRRTRMAPGGPTGRLRIGQGWHQEAQTGPRRALGPEWPQEAHIGPGWPQEDQTGPRRARGEAFGMRGGPAGSRMAPGSPELVRDCPWRPTLPPGGPHWSRMAPK